jgi:DNA-binding MarR family transcriptional regulator
MLRSEVLCEEVSIALRQIARAIDLHSKRLVQQHGVTGPQALLLKRLLESDAITVGELAKQVSLSQATVTEVLTRLETKGLVQRTRSGTDRRRVLVSATEAAAEVVNEKLSLLHNDFTAQFAQLEQWEQLLIVSCLQRVAAMMGVESLPVGPVLSSGGFATESEETAMHTQELERASIL